MRHIVAWDVCRWTSWEVIISYDAHAFMYVWVVYPACDITILHELRTLPQRHVFPWVIGVVTWYCAFWSQSGRGGLGGVRERHVGR